jgi:hypothetical protein
MNITGFSRTQLIELETAEGFLAHYNALRGSTYAVERVACKGEAPDVFTKDASGNLLNIEVTLTEDRSRDIGSVLGPSNHKSLDMLKAHLQRVKEGKEQVKINCLSENVLAVLIDRINSKLRKRYGNNVALVVRDTSGVSWDWKQVVPQLQAGLSRQTVHFDRGIWLLSCCKSVLTPIYIEAV